VRVLLLVPVLFHQLDFSGLLMLILEVEQRSDINSTDRTSAAEDTAARLDDLS